MAKRQDTSDIVPVNGPDCACCGQKLVRGIGERPSAWMRRRYCSKKCAATMGPRRPIEERMSDKTDTSLGHGPDGDCHIWLAYRDRAGYGVVRLNGATELAHRVSYTLSCGAIPDGLFVCHKCDNPACVRPDHLFLGTNAENMADMKSKGRQRAPRGVENRRSKLDDAAIRSIRDDPRKHREIGAQYGVTHRIVGQIKRGLLWKHVQ